MPSQPAAKIPFEDSVRRLSELRWSQRDIARYLRTNQTKVSREQRKINTGPHPIIPVVPEGQAPGPESLNGNLRLKRYRLPRIQLHPGTLLVVALLLLAAVALTLIISRLLAAPAEVPQVTACVQYAQIAGRPAVTGLAAGGGCPPGWKTVILTPGR